MHLPLCPLEVNKFVSRRKIFRGVLHHLLLICLSDPDRMKFLSRMFMGPTILDTNVFRNERLVHNFSYLSRTVSGTTRSHGVEILLLQSFFLTVSAKIEI